MIMASVIAQTPDYQYLIGINAKQSNMGLVSPSPKRKILTTVNCHGAGATNGVALDSCIQGDFIRQ